METLRSLIESRFPEIEFPEAAQTVLLVSDKDLPPLMRFLKKELRFDYLESISCVDYPEFFEIVYHIQSVLQGYFIAVKTRLFKEEPVCPSVVSVWRGADWHEREIFDLFGVWFEGHPNLKRIFMPEDWKGFPLRKDYEQFEEYHGISCLTEKPENGGKTF